MRIQPNTTINLYSNVPIDNGEQLTFRSKGEQTSYFRSKLVRSNVECTVVKQKSGTLRLELSGSIVSQCNYLSFVNPSFDNKIIYCKIVDYDYVNNECTEIKYIIDPWQTWCFDVTFDNMFIEREHISQAAKNLLDNDPYSLEVPEMLTAENLAYGDAIENPKGFIYKKEPSDDSQYPNNFGHSLFYDENVITERDYYDVIFASPVNYEYLDEDVIYKGAFWYEYINDEATCEQYGLKSFTAWLEWQRTLGPNPSNYWLSSPSEEIQRFINEIIGYGHYAFYLDGHWEYNLTGSPHTIDKNTHMNMPYDIYCIPQSNIYDRSSQRLIDAYTRMGCMSSIMGMYTLPGEILEDYFAYQGETQGKQHGVKTSKQRMTENQMKTVESHKLLRFPYCYFSLQDCDGNQREVRYEDCSRLSNGEANVYTYVDLNTHPVLAAVPDSGFVVGEVRGESMVRVSSYTLENAMTYDAIPQTPYNTDQYLAFVAESAKSTIGQNDSKMMTNLAKEQIETKAVDRTLLKWGDFEFKESDIKNIGAIIGGGLSAGKGDIGGILGGIDTILNQQKVYEQQKIAEQEHYQNMRLIGGSYGTLGGEKNALDVSLSATKPAYAANVFHAGSRGGIMHYLKGLNPIDIYVRYHQPNDSILETYDNYFKSFGYKSNRAGIPRVIRYMQGANNTNELPTWVTINGRQTTYIQTSACKVLHAMQPVADAISAMFDSGVRFIKPN